MAVPMSYSQAHHGLASAIRAAFPNSPWLAKITAGTAFLAAGADFYVSKQLSRDEGLSRSELERKIAKLYEERAKELSGTAHVQDQAQTQAQQVTVNVTLPVEPRPSMYLMEEGNPDINTDCFSCASAHLAGMEGALQRAKHAAERAGRCDDECQKWLTLAAQEPSALFARDWTPEKMAKWPEWQRAVVEKYGPEVKEIQAKLLGNDPQAESLVDGAAVLKEATRFTGAGDGVTHPEVEWRIARAEADLSAAERVDVGGLPPDVAQEVRHLRQDLGSRISSPEDVTRAAQEADRISRQVMAPKFSAMTPDEIGALADQVHELRTGFRAERRELAQAHQMAMIGRVPRRSSDAHVPRDLIERYTSPTEAVVEETTDRENVAIAYDNLEREVEARGTRIRYRNLPSTYEETIFGLYDRDNDTILLDSFTKTAKDPFSFQVLSHETTHALIDGPKCYGRGYEEGTGYQQQPSELRAQAASLAAMIELGLPVELADGTDLPPGERQVDWQKFAREAGPDIARDAKWASDWIVRAARDEDMGLAEAICPARERAMT